MLVLNGIAYAIDACVVAVVLVRRDVVVEGWSDLWAGGSVLKQAMSFGLGVLRSNAAAKMINVKDSL